MPTETFCGALGARRSAGVLRCVHEGLKLRALAFPEYSVDAERDPKHDFYDKLLDCSGSGVSCEMGESARWDYGGALQSCD